MTDMKIALLVATLWLTAPVAFAQKPAPATSESRDAATALIGSMQFTVGRIGRDCLTSLDRQDSPQEFANVWLQRNGKYANAAAKYLQARLTEVELKGASAKDAVVRDLAAVRSSAEQDIHSLYAKHGKEAACKRMVALIDEGAYDITSRVPMFNELESLVAWAQE